MILSPPPFLSPLNSPPSSSRLAVLSLPPVFCALDAKLASLFALMTLVSSCRNHMEPINFYEVNFYVGLSNGCMTARWGLAWSA